MNCYSRKFTRLFIDPRHTYLAFTVGNMFVECMQGYIQLWFMIHHFDKKEEEEKWDLYANELNRNEFISNRK